MNGDNQITKEKKGVAGSLVGSIIVVIILIIGGIYLFSSRPTTSLPEGGDLPPADNQATGALRHQGQSDEISTIEADLESTELELLDQAVNDLNRALEEE